MNKIGWGVVSTGGLFFLSAGLNFYGSRPRILWLAGLGIWILVSYGIYTGTAMLVSRETAKLRPDVNVKTPALSPLSAPAPTSSPPASINITGNNNPVQIGSHNSIQHSSHAKSESAKENK